LKILIYIYNKQIIKLLVYSFELIYCCKDFISSTLFDTSINSFSDKRIISNLASISIAEVFILSLILSINYFNIVSFIRII